MVHQLRNDDSSNIVPKMRLVRQRAIFGEQQVLREALPVLAESLVERVVAHSLEPALDLVEQVVLVCAVALVEELVARILEPLTFVGKGGGEDEAGLEEGLKIIEVNANDQSSNRTRNEARERKRTLRI